MRHTLRGTVTLSLALMALAGCASSPAPRELLDARVSYANAQSGPAGQLVPAQVHVAKVALDRAELSFEREESPGRTADLAYVACGRFEAFYEYGLNPWDVAAGALLVKEAGGTVTGVIPRRLFPREIPHRGLTELLELADDHVERVPRPRRLARPAVDDEVFRSLRHLGIEVVEQHAQRCLLPPAEARDRKSVV